MNLPLLSLLLLLMTASLSCQRLQNDFELENSNTTNVDEDKSSDLGNTSELNKTQLTNGEDLSSEGN